MNSLFLAANWFPDAASTHAALLDGPFFQIMMAALVVLVVFTGLAIVYVAQFRREGQFEEGKSLFGNALVWRGLWVLGALALGLLAAGAGFGVFVDRTEAPFASETIIVTAEKGHWSFAYPNGHVADTLHVAVGKPVQLLLGSADVLHSLTIPAFRLNEGIVPGRMNSTWVEATLPGTYDLHSNIYSGAGFDSLRTAVVVQDPVEYDAWMAAVADIFAGRTLAEVGELLYNSQGCKTCHTLDGSKLVGPSFKNVYGHEFETESGETIVANDAYIKESILTPNVSVIKGFQPVMTPYAGILDDRKIEAITEFLKTLSDRGGVEEAAADTGAGETTDTPQQEGN